MVGDLLWAVTWETAASSGHPSSERKSKKLGSDRRAKGMAASLWHLGWNFRVTKKMQLS